MNLLSSTCQSVHPTVLPAPSIRTSQRPPAQTALVKLATLLPVACVLVCIIPPCVCHRPEDDDIKHVTLYLDSNWAIVGKTGVL